MGSETCGQLHIHSVSRQLHRTCRDLWWITKKWLAASGEKTEIRNSDDSYEKNTNIPTCKIQKIRLRMAGKTQGIICPEWICFCLPCTMRHASSSARRATYMRNVTCSSVLVRASTCCQIPALYLVSSVCMYVSMSFSFLSFFFD